MLIIQNRLQQSPFQGYLKVKRAIFLIHTNDETFVYSFIFWTVRLFNESIQWIQRDPQTSNESSYNCLKI